MRLAIVGSREFNDYTLLCEKLSKVKKPITQVISGEAKGADLLGKRWAEDHGVPYLGFPALWDDISVAGAVIKKRVSGELYNVKAGFDRNQTIVDNADAVIAFWDGKSSGTKDTIQKANKKSIPCFIVRYDLPEAPGSYANVD